MVAGRRGQSRTLAELIALQALSRRFLDTSEGRRAVDMIQNILQDSNRVDIFKLACQAMIDASKPRACPASMPSRKKECAVGTAVSQSRPRSRASSWIKLTSTSTGGLMVGQPRLWRARVLTPFRKREEVSGARRMGLLVRRQAGGEGPAGSIWYHHHKKGRRSNGWLLLDRYSKIAVWNSLMDENDYLTKRWTEFLNA